jgi:hypothetical protein
MVHGKYGTDGLRENGVQEERMLGVIFRVASVNLQFVAHGMVRLANPAAARVQQNSGT